MDAQDRIIFAQTNGGKRIGTARDRIGAVRGGMTLLAWYQQQAHAIGFPFDLLFGGVAQAEVNHGRWIVRCSVCGGAEEADPSQPVFYCMSCGNAETGGKVLLVEFPTNREAIEAELLKRPDVGTRNWLPGETVEELERELAEHGIEIRN